MKRIILVVLAVFLYTALYSVQINNRLEFEENLTDSGSASTDWSNAGSLAYSSSIYKYGSFSADFTSTALVYSDANIQETYKTAQVFLYWPTGHSMTHNVPICTAAKTSLGGWFIQIYQNNIYFECYNNRTTGAIAGPSFDTWERYNCVNNSDGNAYFYRDGAEIGSCVSDGAWGNDTFSVYAGYYQPTGSLVFNGYMDRLILSTEEYSDEITLSTANNQTTFPFRLVGH